MLNQTGSIKTDPFIRGSGQAIKIAAAKLKEMGYIRLRVLSDQQGIFCIEYPKFFLTTNKYLYQKHIVSSQKEIIYRANICCKDLVVFVLEEDNFYIFNPQNIINNHWENLRGYLLMYNWDISMGKVLQT